MLHTVHLPDMLLRAGDADADVTCAPTAAIPDSCVEVMAGELTSKWPGGGSMNSGCCSVLACMVCANSLI
jgi:hypothetical protein